MAIVDELKKFLLRGNVVDMAVGVVIGGAFGKIVSSFVADILMPPISLLFGNQNFTELNIVLRNAVMEGETVVAPAITWNYGTFLQVLLDFLIIGISIFFVVRVINKLNHKKEEPVAAPEPPAPSKEETLLTEIRDLLKNK